VRISAAGRAPESTLSKVKAKGEKANVVTMSKKRTMSASVRRRIAAATRSVDESESRKEIGLKLINSTSTHATNTRARQGFYKPLTTPPLDKKASEKPQEIPI
jgi:hypothetical protein